MIQTNSPNNHVNRMPLADMRYTRVPKSHRSLSRNGCRDAEIPAGKKKKDRPVYSTDVHVRYGSKSLPTAVPVTRCCSTALKNGTIRQLHRSNKDKKYREVTNHANLFGEHWPGVIVVSGKMAEYICMTSTIGPCSRIQS